MQPDELKRLVAILNPDKIEGRLVLITRYGKDKIASQLPTHIKAVQVSRLEIKGRGAKLGSIKAQSIVALWQFISCPGSARSRGPSSAHAWGTLAQPVPTCDTTLPLGDIADGTWLMIP